MRHSASPEFWACYHVLPKSIQELADKNFALLKRDPQHPSLHFRKIGRFRSARVGLSYRALGVDVADGILWFWIGTHLTVIHKQKVNPLRFWHLVKCVNEKSNGNGHSA